MSIRPMHRALPGVLALAAALSLNACTVAIGAAPETASRNTRPAPRPEIVIPAEPLAAGELAPGASLLIPVRGIRPAQLADTYADARSGGRTHHAIDIMAPAGSPVVAAADGTVHRLRTGGLGGITIYQFGDDGRTLYYYAHLQRYAAGIREGQRIRCGEIIAYVGDTGNAGAGNYHLHFSVGRLSNPERYWESENVNPYPLLAGSAARVRTPVARDR
ncbi:M23 family metallopeptidase [Longimicrobium terrae]|uniref:Murein DD-endopeptidase MepM/ murein hydrolase activator NlpD n=1 Tax=Longimicrobium terrae TaxID=1639882 RepID=A0A841H7Z2_9BACT|nr:M23 family metallopeptidase [Longimicrobium terrae]MBB4639585.1 murein DD-endopeptidase MepM/ murein hydrolase activator NlpD [Longimicrobium terrae]MBB6073956.1 murein DD-endopeptidase MepM/ murein hydrolase activator NlpD [Longimicrobium terrae]NNC29120.1 M23 family metallopeptidase [Longimicrobium terrae]